MGLEKFPNIVKVTCNILPQHLTHFKEHFIEITFLVAAWDFSSTYFYQ
jgi:hypothetical protein